MDKASLRALHIVPSARWHGDDATLPGLIRALRTRHAIDSHVFLLTDRSVPGPSQVDEPDVSRVKGAMPTRLLQLLRNLERESGAFQIVHTQGCRAGLIGTWLAERTQALAVRTIGRPSVFNVGWKNRLRYWSDCLCTRMQKAVVCTDPSCDEPLPRRTGLQVESIDAGIDLADLEARAKQSIDMSGFGTGYHVGFAGPLTQDKQLDMFLATAYALNRDHPGRFLFHVFGEGESRAACEAFARRHGLSCCVFFHGNVPLAPWLRQMDALLSCTKTDTAPVAVLEAMALTVPVVTRASGIVPSLLEFGACGTLVHEHAPHAYAAALVALANTPETARDRAALAARRARRVHDLARTADTYARLFRSLTATPQCQSSSQQATLGGSSSCDG